VENVQLQAKQRKRRRLVGWLCWLFVAMLLIYWATLLLLGDKWWPATLLLYGPRWPLALPLILLFPMAWKWRRRALIPCLISLLLLVFPITGFNIPIASLMETPPPEYGSLRIVTFNADMGKIRMKDWNDFLIQTKPDIVVCQEWPVGFERPDEWKQGWHVQEHLGNLLVVSRWPISKTELLRENELGIRGYVGWYDLTTPLGPVSLADVHLPTPRGEGELEEALHGKWRRFAELDTLSERRLKASRDVRQWLSRFPEPMLVVGDFNLPSDSSIYGNAWSRYHDAFTQAGWGWGYSKWTRWYGIRIDHILFDHGWVATSCRLGKDVGSDHLPLIADLVFTGGN